MLWILGSVAGALVLTFLILFVVFSALRGQISAEAARLANKELDSGLVKMTTRYDQFRTGRLYRGGGLRMNYTQVVLTKTHLHLIERPQWYGVFPRAELAKFTVGILDGKLHLHSKSPPNATGGIDYRIPVADPEHWVKALAAAGAKRAS